MPIYAKCTFGPQEKPNGYCYVEILTQLNETPFGRFRVRDVRNSLLIFDVWKPQLELVFWLPPEGQQTPKQES